MNALEKLVDMYITGMNNSLHITYLLSNEGLDFLVKNESVTKQRVHFLLTNGKKIYDVTKTLQKLEERGLKLTDNETRAIYDGLIENGRLRELDSLLSRLRVEMTPEQKKRSWKRFLSQEWSDHAFESMVAKCGIPQLAQEEIDIVCNDWLGTYTDNKGKQILQPKEFSLFLNAIDKTPNWDRQEVERIYERWTSRGWMHEEMFAFLQNHTSIQLTKNQVNDYYEKLLMKEDNLKWYVPKAMKQLGAPSQEVVEKYYATAPLRKMNEVAKLTNIPIPEQFLKDACVREMKKGIIPTEVRSQLVEFYEQEILDVYVTLFTENKHEQALQVYLHTDIDPVQTPEVEKCYIHILEDVVAQKSLPESLKWLSGHFQKMVYPHVQNAYRQLVAEDRFDGVQRLAHLSSVQPEPPVQFVLSCVKANWENAKHLLEKDREAIEKEYLGWVEAAETYL